MLRALHSDAGLAAGARPSQLEQRIDELEQVYTIAQEMGGLLEKLTKLTDRPAEFNRLIVRVDELRTLMHKFGRTYALIVDVSSAAELRRYRADRRIGSPERETRDTAQKRLARDREFVDAFSSGCAFLRQVFPEALARAEQRL